MQRSEHVMMAGEGAEIFAKAQGLQMVHPAYFHTEKSWNSLQKALKAKSAKVKENFPDNKFGTVGAVALDKYGSISAGTSTDGMTNKKHGRIGDSPVIGAGTYANEQVGVSGTGWGEYFIRSVAAHSVAAKIKYQNKTLMQAAREVIDEIEKMDGDGDIIALDRNGNIAMPFSTKGMYRAAITGTGEVEVNIYK